MEIIPAPHHPHLASLLTIALCWQLCGSWAEMATSLENVPPDPDLDPDLDLDPCPLTCSCSSSSFPFSPRPLVTLQCMEVGKDTFSVATCNATQALLMPHSHVRDLSTLPPFPHLLLLDLSSNSVTCSRCREVFARMGLLVHLNLSRNAIQSLQEGTFSGLDRLEVLDLSRNGLTVIQPHAFQGLHRLSVLHLEYNRLYEVSRSWLMSMSSLHELYLQGNRISEVDGYTFAHNTFLLQLDLSNNALNAVSQHAFVGLQRLKMLNLSSNDLVEIPSRELQRLPGLAILLLDGIAVTMLKPGDFSQLNVSSISLSFLPNLSMVSRGAFSNLTGLRTLQMHDNYRLVFIHPEAFDHVPLLHRLALHNNQLVTLSSAVRDSLPSLDELHLYHNPLHCDCNIFWLKQDMVDMDDSINASLDTYLRHWDKLLCTSPSSRSRAELKHVALHLLSPSCPPTTLPFFPDTYHVTVGDEVSLQCQAVGVPDPVLSWVLPGGQVTNDSTDGFHIVSPDSTTLTLPAVSLQDKGTYSCRADNGLGFDTSSTVLHVHNKDLRLSVSPASPDTEISVRWTGSVPQQQMGQYRLLYSHNGAENTTTHWVDLDSSLHNVTLTDLLPLTSYRLCLVFRDVFVVHCVNITTGNTHTLKAAPSRKLSSVSSTVVSICVMVGVLVAVLGLVCFIRRRWIRLRGRGWRGWRGRLEEEEEEEKEKERRESLTEDKEMEKILLEPIDQRVPDSPRCTPRSALLPRSYV